jgi:hypothetical protein
VAISGQRFRCLPNQLKYNDFQAAWRRAARCDGSLEGAAGISGFGADASSRLCPDGAQELDQWPAVLAVFSGHFQRHQARHRNRDAGDGVCFMHGIHGSDHHLLAFAKSSATGLHHCSWDVGSIEEIDVRCVP